MLTEIEKLVSDSGLSTEYLTSAEQYLWIENPRGEVIAYIGVERRGNLVHIQSLAVDKNYRKIGIGKRLVDEVFETLNPGETLVALTLFWNNQFYQNLGFTKLNAREIKHTDDVGAREKHKYCTAWGKLKP